MPPSITSLVVGGAFGGGRFAAMGTKKLKYTMKDVSERTSLSVYTLRYYAREGLFQMVKHDHRGVYRFTEADMESVYIIECLKGCGMSIREIREFTDWTLAGDGTIGRRLALFEEKHALMEEELRRRQEILDALRYKVWFYQKASEAGTVDVHDRMPPEDVPEEMREIRARMAHAERLTRRP